MKQLVLSTLLSGLVTVMVPTYAGVIDSQLPSGNITFEDDSAERWIDVNQNGLLDVGDKLRAIVNIPSWFTNATGTTNFAGELSGISEIEVTSAVSLGGGLYNYTFGPSASFEAVYGTGAMIALYEDTVQEFSRNGSSCDSAADVAVGGLCESLITDGDLWMVLGFGGDLDEFWTALGAPGNPLLGLLVTPSTQLPGNFNFGLSILTNLSDSLWGSVGTPIFFEDQATGDNKVGFAGSGTLQGTLNANTGYTVYDDFQFDMNRIPEPNSLALLGLGLVGAAFIRRRAKAQN